MRAICGAQAMTRTEDETYLGDAVYASFDGYQIWLRPGDAGAQRIALEPPVFAALVAYREYIYRELSTKRENTHDHK